jgi:hypothetical protein
MTKATTVSSVAASTTETPLAVEPAPEAPAATTTDCLAALATAGYQCLLGPNAMPHSARNFAVGTYVWVLKSKGRKRKQSHASAAASQPSAPVATLHKQLLQLFGRARIIDNPGTTQSRQESYERNDYEEENNDEQELLQELLQELQALPTADHTAEDSTNVPRIWIQYPKGSTYYIKRNRLCHIIEKDHGLVLVWPETDVYCKSALQHTLPIGEAFCEIGCDHGATLDRVARGLGDHTLVLGIDKAADSIASARKRYPQHPFMQWDCLAQDDSVPPELTDLIQRSTSWNLALDINGNREMSAVIKALRRLLVDLQLRPRLVFCKSRALYLELLRTAVET